MIRGVHHVAVATGDIDRLVGFYEAAFGFEVASDGGWASGNDVIDGIVGLPGSAARVVTMRAGNTYVELFQYETPEGRPGDPNRPVCDHGYTHFCLDVTDIDAEYERLSALGMRFHAAPAPASKLGGGRLRAAYGRDPDGNVIEIQEILDPAYPLRLPG